MKVVSDYYMCENRIVIFSQFLAVVLLTYAVVGVPSSDEKATILRQQQDSDPDGNYQFTLVYIVSIFALI